MQFKNLLLTGIMIIGLVCNVWAGGKTSETLFMLIYYLNVVLPVMILSRR